MQRLAAEMNLSETAFLHREPDHWGLRWFTPRREVDLCGHATLASAHALWETGALAPHVTAEFETRSGRLTCRREQGSITMDFPANPAHPAAAPDGLWQALGIKPCPVLRNVADYLLVATDADTVRSCSPDFAALARLEHVHGVVLTAPGDDGIHDYLCRYFVPAYGINEDPVTGSIQTMLGPYWSPRLGKREMKAWQASARGGGMTVRPEGTRVVLIGRAVTTVAGELAPLALPPPSLKN